MRYKEVIEGIEKNRTTKLSGDLVAIPWERMPKFSEYIPGIQQGNYIGITGASKSAKSYIAFYMYVYQPLEWLFDNLNKTDITIKIFINSLELSHEFLILRMISYRLYTKYSIIRSPEELQSSFKDYTIDEDTITIIKSEDMQNWLKFIDERVEVNTETRHPYGIHSIVKEYAINNGHYTRKTKNFYKEIKDVNGKVVSSETYQEEVNDKYIPDRPREFVIVLNDHISLLALEKKHKSIYDAVDDHSSKYALELRDKFNYTICDVIQQNASSSEETWTRDGALIANKVLPTKEGLSSNKSVGNNLNLLLGIFHPGAYNIPKWGDGRHKSWDLEQIGKNYRELRIILNRSGVANEQVSLAFNGACGYFQELPYNPDELTKNKIYSKIKNWSN